MPKSLGRFFPILAAVGLVVVVAVVAGDRAGPPRPEPATGQQPEAVVIDGDTLQLGGTVIQLYGIDAPELGQQCFHDGQWFHCGLDAAFELHQLIQKEHAAVLCGAAPGAMAGVSGAESGPRVQVCRAGTVDVAGFLLRSGYVVATPETTEGYRDAEATARSASLGLWHSEFVLPSEWRAGQRLPDEAAAEAAGKGGVGAGVGAGSCPVKAVVSAAGERLYYVPTDDGYPALEADPAKVTQSFCSDEAARLAGWRRAGEGAADAAVGDRDRSYGVAEVIE
ncbi:MAG: thermonuclease family protein [Kiloniellaceae bacterium]